MIPADDAGGEARPVFGYAQSARQLLDAIKYITEVQSKFRIDSAVMITPVDALLTDHYPHVSRPAVVHGCHR